MPARTMRGAAWGSDMTTSARKGPRGGKTVTTRSRQRSAEEELFEYGRLLRSVGLVLELTLKVRDMRGRVARSERRRLDAVLVALGDFHALITAAMPTVESVRAAAQDR